MSYFEWSERQLEFAIRQRREGASAAEIAAALGTTRNAVLGKLHRLGARGSKRGSKRRATPPKSGGVQIGARGEPAKIRWFKATRAHVELTDLRSDSCRFPFDCDDGETLYCGRQRAVLAPYCAEHTLLTRRPINELPRRRSGCAPDAFRALR